MYSGVYDFSARPIRRGRFGAAVSARPFRRGCFGAADSAPILFGAAVSALAVSALAGSALFSNIALDLSMAVSYMI